MSVTISRHDTPDELASAVAKAWLTLLQSRLPASGDTRHTVALSGGRIARTFFSEVVRQSSGYPKELLRAVHFFWGDERCVPPTDAESNYAIARELLFEPLNIPGENIHRLRGEDVDATAIAEGTKDIHRFTTTSNGQPVFDVVFLGMGEDGHVASLFPGESEAVMADPAIYRVVTAVKPPPRRITLGYGALAAAKECWVLASGQGKEAALRESLTDGNTPLARVLKSRSKTTIYTDIQLPQIEFSPRKKIYFFPNEVSLPAL